MKKMLVFAFALLLLTAVAASAGWEFVRNFPNNDFKPAGGMGSHGIIVDREGKVWLQMYGATTTITKANGTTGNTRQIFCFYPDGTPTPWSGANLVTGFGQTDTLYNSHRGLGMDHDGNILWTAYPYIYRFNYKTGELMQRIVPQKLTSYCAPVADADGDIYLGYVLPGNPVETYGADGSYLGNVTDSQDGYGRTMAVTDDGLSVYVPRYDKKFLLRYTRPDKFSPFAVPDTLCRGAATASMNWNYATGKLWLDGGNNDEAPSGGRYKSMTWYEIDPVTFTPTDSIQWKTNDPTQPAGEKPRGITFTVTGDSAYVSCFGADYYVPAQMFVKTAGGDVNVTFRINMGVQQQYGNFNPATDKVVIRGSFNGWAGDADECLPTAEAGVYALTKTFPAAQVGTDIEYKYVLMPGDRWESIDNRKLTIPGASKVLDMAFYNNIDKYTETKTANVTFQADVTDMLAKGFNPATDEILVLGGFNGWAYNDEWIAQPDLVVPTLYTVTHAITDIAGTTQGWKWRGRPAENFADNGWEGGDNHTFTFTGEDLVLPAFKPNVTPAGKKLSQEVTVTFSVDTKGAKDYFNKKAFPTVEKVVLNGDFAPLGTGGWAGWGVADIGSTLISMFDDGTNGDATAGDQIWTVQVKFPAGSTASHYYKYGIYSTGYTDTLNAGTTPMDNEAGIAMNHVVTISDANPVFVVPTDKFGSQWVKVDRIPTSGLPAEFTLNANYPNPFNPTTFITYDLPMKSHVRLTIFNAMGQIVANLVDGEQNAGSYRVSWNGTNLDGSVAPSGIYFYRLEGNGFAKTMKMTLMK